MMRMMIRVMMVRMERKRRRRVMRKRMMTMTMTRMVSSFGARNCSTWLISFTS